MKQSDILWMVGFGLATFLFYILFGGNMPVTDPVESNYTLTALNMIEDKSYLIPVIYHQPWFDKPIWTYWALIGSYKLFGVNDIAARLPSILAAALSVSSLFYITRRITGRLDIAIAAVGILATTIEFWYIGHAVITDMWLFLGSIWCFGLSFEGIVTRRHSLMVGAYMAAGFTILVKGPVGLVLPGAVLLLFALYRRNVSDLKYIFSPWGIIAFVLVALPWYIYMYTQLGMEFLAGFLGIHNYMRATVSEHPKDNVWFYYILNVIIAMMPWTLLMVYGLVEHGKRFLRQYKERYSINSSIESKTDELIKWISPFMMIWFLVIFCFYTAVSTKYPTYTFIGIIPLVIMTAEQALAISDGGATKRFLKSNWTIVGFVVILSMALISAGFVEDVPPVALIKVFVVMAILISLFIHKGYNGRRLLYLGATVTMLMYGGLSFDLRPVMMDKSMKDLATYVRYDSKTVYFYEDYYTSLDYYTDKTVIRLNADDSWESDSWLKAKRVMPQTTVSELTSNLLNNPKNVVTVIVADKHVNKFQKTPLYSRSTYYTKVGDMNMYEVK